MAENTAALRELTGVLEALGLPLTLRDSRGTLIYANAAAAHLLGARSVEELLDCATAERDPYEVLSLDGGPVVETVRPFREVLAGAPLSEHVLEVRGRHSAVVRVLRLRCAPVSLPGTSERFAATVIEDLTAARAEQRERERREARERFLSEATLLLTSTLDYEEVLEHLARLVVPTVADWCSVEIVDETRTSIEQLGMAHVDPAKVALGRELRQSYPLDFSNPARLPRALTEGVPELYPEVPMELQLQGVTDPRHRELIEALGLRSGMIIPLRSRGAVIGMITLVYAESGRRYSEEDVQPAMELAARAALAVDNARLYRRAHEAVERREEFLAVAAHELKTPLTALTLQLSQAERRLGEGTDDGTSLALRSLHQVKRQTRELGELVNSLLEVSRLARNRVTFVRQPTQLLRLATTVVERFNTDAGGLISVEGEEVSGEWDPLQLEQLLAQLLSNAIKYGEGKPVQVRVEPGTDGVVLSVSDGGAGIREADRDRLFRPFERAVPPGVIRGLGLGLYICRKIAEAHGGRIELAPPAKEGTTLRVSLPLGQAGAPAAETPSSPQRHSA